MLNKEQIRDIIVQRSRDEQNGKIPHNFTHSYEMTNPLCGDHVKVFLYLRKGDVFDLSYHSAGCTICMASSSLMKEEISFLEKHQVLEKIQMFQEHLNAREVSEWPSELENLKYFEHLKKNPSRQMCAFLPWATLRGALKNQAVLNAKGERR